MNLNTERYYVFLGLLFGLIPVYGFARSFYFDLEIISITFGALLAIAAIIQGSWDSKTFARLKISGHDRYVLEYLSIPIYVSFLLLVMQTCAKIIVFPMSVEYLGLTRLLFGALSFALLGLLFLSTFRLVCLISPLIKKEND